MFATRSTSDSDPGSVLVVDGDCDLCELTSTWLELSGFHVLTAPDPRSARQRLAAGGDITCVVVDLPPSGGTASIELLADVRGRLPHCRTVVVSVLDAAHYPPADAALPKPFSRARLVAAVTGTALLPTPRTAGDLAGDLAGVDDVVAARQR